MADGLTFADFVGALDLFADAILCGAVAGAVLGYLGVLIVLRRMVFVTAAISQSAGLGVALGAFVGIQVGFEAHSMFWAVATSMVAALLVGLDHERVRLSRESVLAFVWLVGSGGAVLLGERIAHEAHDVSDILFGTAVLVRPEDLRIVLVVGVLTLAAAVLSQKALLFVGYDRDGARSQGLPVRILELGFLGLVTLMVSVATRALGALPVFAFSVLPAMAALMAVPRLRWTFPVALLAGIVSATVGYMAAFFLSFPVGASQAAVASVLVLLAIPIRLLRRG